MKKLLVLLLAVLCIFTFVACEASPSNSNNDSTEVTPPTGGGGQSIHQLGQQVKQVRHGQETLLMKMVNTQVK